MWWWITFVMVVGLVTLPWWAARTTTVTSQRVIKRAGLIWRQSQAVPLIKIADVNTVIGPLAASVFLTSAGGPSMIIGPLTKDSARRFAAALEAAREGTNPTFATPASVETVSVIRQTRPTSGTPTSIENVLADVAPHNFNRGYRNPKLCRVCGKTKAEHAQW